jgi:hypothetical protein
MVKAITFDLDGGDLKVPVVGQYELNLPPYFATKTKKGWKLLNPITTIRNLAKRNKELVVDLNRSPSSLEPEIAEEEGVDMPSIEDFNPTDQKKLRRWEANKNKQGVYPKTDKPIRPRGRPAFLPKNARLQGLTYKKGTKHYGDNLNKKKKPEPESESDEEHYDEPPPPPSPPQSDSESSSESESEEEEEKRPRGRPKSKATLEKERKAKEAKEAEEKRKADAEKFERERPAREKAQKEKEERERQQRIKEQEERQQKFRDERNEHREKRSMEGQDTRTKEKEALRRKEDARKYAIEQEPKIMSAPLPKHKSIPADLFKRFDYWGGSRINVEPKDGKEITDKEWESLPDTIIDMTYFKGDEDIEGDKDPHPQSFTLYKKIPPKHSEHKGMNVYEYDFYFREYLKGELKHERNASYNPQTKQRKADITPTPDLGRLLDNYAVIKEGKYHQKTQLEDLPAGLKEFIKRRIMKQRGLRVEALHEKGRGLSGGLNPNRTNDQDDSDAEGGDDYDDGRDGKTTGGSIFSGLLSKVKSLVINPIEAVVNKVGDIGNKVIHGRMDYPPSAKAIIDKYGDQQVQGVSLHRLVLPSVYTGILSLWTGGETARRLKEEPKDKLFHISMWVKLPNAVILCEKNEVIHLKVNPTKAKEEEEQDAPTPSNTTFRELLEKGRASVGDEKFFSYSAKSNNCGNWIEYILRANGIENQGTKDFIGQDAHKILEGFPRLRRTLNTLTDIAGRANVVLEGGDLPDWEHLNWGSFTKQFERYNEEHPDNGIEDLEHFARSILANPKEYQPRTLKRARFYLNVILKKKSHHNNIMPSHRINGGAVIGLPVSNAVIRPAVWNGAGYENGKLMGADPRTWSPMPIHANHPNAMDTIFHDPNGHPSASGIHHHHHYHMGGMGFFDDIGRAFDPKQNGVAKAFDPNQNGVAQAFAPNGSAEQFGKQVASTLIHKGLPIAGQVAGSTLGNFLAPELGGLGGFALGQAGKAGGNALGDLIGKETGYGLKPKRLVKGSAEAKAFMASIRKKKMKGGDIPAPRSRLPITDPSML